ncbi:MAG: hypothetical protein RLZZ117_132 [Cyanobacteriota bacterium]|jgi:hypothetical protein
MKKPGATPSQLAEPRLTCGQEGVNPSGLSVRPAGEGRIPERGAKSEARMPWSEFVEPPLAATLPDAVLLSLARPALEGEVASSWPQA